MLSYNIHTNRLSVGETVRAMDMRGSASWDMRQRLKLCTFFVSYSNSARYYAIISVNGGCQENTARDILILCFSFLLLLLLNRKNTSK